MKKTLLLLTLSFQTAIACAQSGTVLRGRAVDASDGNPVGFATAALLRDSVSAAAVAADAQGRFELAAPAAGDYLLQISMVGYRTAAREVSLREPSADIGDIALEQGVAIDEVTVTVQKPIVTADAEKTIYSVEDDPAAATSTLEEILRKVPQLTIDAEGNVRLNGQSDYKVLVNGRESAMFRNFKDVIRSMPAAQIKRIEVIVRPSMKYDAEGSGGIINIVTARQEFDGCNGSLSYSPSLVGRSQHYGSGSLSLQKGKFAVSLQGGFFTMNNRDVPHSSESRQENFASDDRRYRFASSEENRRGRNGWGTINVSYQPDSLDLVTLEGTYWSARWKSHADERIVFADRTQTPTADYLLHGDHDYPVSGFQIGTGYERRFRKPEHTLTLSDLIEIEREPGYLETLVYEGLLDYPSSQLRKYESGRNITNTLQVDYSNPLAEHHSIEAGGKYRYRIDKNYQDEIPCDAGGTPDPAANTTRYDDLRQRQQILALYFGYGMTCEKFSGRAGIRMERTWNHADVDDSREGIYAYGNRLLNFIPYLSLTYKPADGHSLSISYTERLLRPSISMLSTYVDASDPFDISQGNPDLKASTTRTLTLKYDYFSPKWSGSLALSGFLSNDGISRWTGVDGTGVARTTYSNNVRERTANVQLSINYNPSDKFSFSFNGQGGYDRYRLPAEAIDTREFTLDQNFNTDISLWKAAKLTLGEGYNSGSARLGAASGEYFYYYARLSQRLFKERLQLSVSSYTPFDRYIDFTTTAETPTYVSHGRIRVNARLISFGVYWRFGKQNISVKKTRKSISNDDTISDSSKRSGEGQ